MKTFRSVTRPGITSQNIRPMKVLFYTVSIMILFASCSHDDEADTQSPSMVMENPREGDIYKVGDEFHMVMNITDNMSLMECKVQIIPDSIADDHKNTTAGGIYKSVMHGGAWEMTRRFEISGTSYNINELIIVPDSLDDEPIAHGRYLYKVDCTDHAGNVATREIRFYLKDI